MTFMPVTHIDIRAPGVTDPNLHFRAADAIDLAGVPASSIMSLSSLSVVEHFGLGRYGDSSLHLSETREDHGARASPAPSRSERSVQSAAVAWPARDSRSSQTPFPGATHHRPRRELGRRSPRFCRGQQAPLTKARSRPRAHAGDGGREWPPGARRDRGADVSGPAGCDERVAWDQRSPWWAESRSRYHEAAPLAKGARVLDVACGVGLGLPVLRDASASLVVGADLDPDGLTEAASTGTPVARLDATRMPFPDSTFDLVTSFETIEHIIEPAAFVRELARVLRPTGTLLLSTPNARFTRPPGGVPANPFHVHEYLPEELTALLSVEFASVALAGQRPADRVTPCPYWELPEHAPGGARGRIAVASWKALARFGSLGRALAPVVLRRPLHPGEHDFVFDDIGLDRGHVVVARCTGPR